MNIIQGKKKKQPLHSNPIEKAEELITQWATASSLDSLPIRVRAAVQRRIRKKFNKINRALQKAHEADTRPINEEEFHRCLKTGQSTAPGLDGITYSVIKFLSTVSSNPVLKLFNMIWMGGPIPAEWKKSVIIPIPKPGRPGQFRPISLTSCLCKFFEKIVLGRLLHIIRPKLASVYMDSSQVGTHNSAYTGLRQGLQRNIQFL